MINKNCRLSLISPDGNGDCPHPRDCPASRRTPRGSPRACCTACVCPPRPAFAAVGGCDPLPGAVLCACRTRSLCSSFTTGVGLCQGSRGRSGPPGAGEAGAILREGQLLEATSSILLGLHLASTDLHTMGAFPLPLSDPGQRVPVRVLEDAAYHECANARSILFP